ncbi:MAG: DUF268 domain-containing protein [Alphaproteobacteria bacterium]
MKPLLRRLHTLLAIHGFNPLTLFYSLLNLPWFVADVLHYRAAPRTEGFPLTLASLFPVVADKHATAGATSTQYFIQDLWMARRVIPTAPTQHIDVGSRVDGFVGSLLAAGVPVTQVDIRPLPNPPHGLTFLQDDATHLAKLKTASVASLSSLHAAEHFGLGRYGDPIDPEACFTFMRSLARVLKKGGRLYFATPIGRERLEFNAHRIFAPQTLLTLFTKAGLKVVETSVITTRAVLVEGANPADYAHEDFATGLYIFTK